MTKVRVKAHCELLRCVPSILHFGHLLAISHRYWGTSTHHVLAIPVSCGQAACHEAIANKVPVPTSKRLDYCRRMVASSASRSLDTPTSETSSHQSHSQDGAAIVEIAAHCDIVLQIEHMNGRSKTMNAFRVSTPVLKTNSKYFERLLQTGRFSEAADIEAKHKSIRERYASIAEAPSTELPVLFIQDIGRISTVRAVDALLTDFLYILHGKDTQTFPPVSNLANLAIVADRFDALQIVKTYVRRKKMIKAIDSKTSKVDASLSEEKLRQRLLVAILLEYPPWIEKYSARLITKGRVGKEADIATALWWDLPTRVEEELAYRRECVLETIQSLQSHFLTFYTSRERQCKLGYDTSGQCDSFQLGEMIRFFSRTGTLQLQGTIIDANEAPLPYAGDLHALIDTLRQVPEYQIKFHTHCGIRTRMIPLLDFLETALQFIGICPDCWQEHRGEYAWVESKRPLLWRRQDFRFKVQDHSSRHADIRALFTATERHWA